MSIQEILESVQYVVNRKGRQVAVQIDLATWEAVRHLLEEMAEDEHLGQLMLEVAEDERLGSEFLQNPLW